jgi:uncharacterized protein
VFTTITGLKRNRRKDEGVCPCGAASCACHLGQEPPSQRGRFEKLADWLFVRKKGERYLLIRSFPFNVIKLTERELDLVRAYLNHKESLPPVLHEMLSRNHFFDPEPTADNYLSEHTSAILIMTTACNLRCSGCFASGGDYGLGIGHMPEQVIDATIQYLSDRITSLYRDKGFKGKSNLGVHFFGGEPFIVFDRMRYAVEKAEAASQRLTETCGSPVAPDFFVTTNGTLLKPDRVRFLKEHQFSVLLSIDGPSHDERRPFGSGKGSLTKAIEAFRALRAEGIRTRLNTVVLGEDIENFGEMLAWFRSEIYSDTPELSVYHTFSFQREGPGSPLGDCGTTYAPEQVGAYIDELLDFNSRGYQIYETQLRKKLKSGGTFYKCSSGVKRIAVSPEGRVYPCQGFIDASFDMGSILDGSFEHRSTHISARFARRNIATLLPCRNCVFSALCPHNVDCAARAHYTLGGVEAIDVDGMCRVGYELMDKILFQGDDLWYAIK